REPAAARARGRPARRLGPAASGAGARAHARGTRLLVSARVAVQRASLHSLVDCALQERVLLVRRLLIAVGHRLREAAQVRSDRGGVVAVLQPLALGAQDALLLG